MATILAIKSTVNTNIRTVVIAGGITKTNHADIEDAILNEIRDRGILQVATTGDLAAVSKDNTKIVAVKNNGIYMSLETVASPNGTTTFASADSGFLWELWIATTVLENVSDGTTTDQDYDYTLDDGLAIWMVKVRPESSYSLKIGTTDGGEELTSATALTANQWNTFHFDVDAYGGDVTIYFTGVTDQTIFAIYRVQLP